MAHNEEIPRGSYKLFTTLTDEFSESMRKKHLFFKAEFSIYSLYNYNEEKNILLKNVLFLKECCDILFLGNIIKQQAGRSKQVNQTRLIWWY